ncbi:MAG: peptidoglycan bridge formation glycyltransferase FemA/FemB family protein [Anaerolineales bacterium]|nr:peptidoglycan bridge formation glycyltransferase FemA/FemB family protein [Anaerolineales bacterium]
MMYTMAGLQGMQPQEWNALAASLPGAHVLQTWEWGQVKSRFGWQALPQTWRDEAGNVRAAALVLQRSTAGLRVLYAPKGPLLDWADAPLRRQALSDLGALARRQGAIFVKIDPDVPLGYGEQGQPGAHDDPLGGSVVADLRAAGWRFSDEQIQFRNTVWIDLSPEPETLLANMKQKTRYNVRLAQRKGVRVRPSSLDELDGLYRMYAETSARDGFVIREAGYYRALWSTFMQAGMAEPLVAEAGGQMIAALVVFRFAGKAWYLFGMSGDEQREKMPNHLLQWEAMQRARAAGCQVYDLWGAPEIFDERDALWGVYRFKDGFGGQTIRGLGAWDLPTRPLLYRLYMQALPRLLEAMRSRRQARSGSSRPSSGSLSIQQSSLPKQLTFVVKPCAGCHLHL